MVIEVVLSMRRNGCGTGKVSNGDWRFGKSV
jgi:hypothetical protein